MNLQNRFLIVVVSFIVYCTSLNGQIKVISSGKVGIGITPSTYFFDVNGTVRFTTGYFSGTSTGMLFTTYYTDGILDPLYDNRNIIGYYNKWKLAYINNIWTAVPVTISDEKLKENIRPISNALESVIKLRGVQYDFKPDYFAEKDENGKSSGFTSLPIKNRIGLIAQETAKIFPDLVVYDSVKQIHGIVYENLIPVLVEAIKQQQVQIDSLKKITNEIYLDNTKKAYSVAENSENNNSECLLFQNVPNPFSENTTINCIVPGTITEASLLVFNMEGTLIKSFLIKNRNQIKVTISGSELQAGMYIYTLVADGKEVDTKRMILTD